MGRELSTPPFPHLAQLEKALRLFRATRTVKLEGIRERFSERLQVILAEARSCGKIRDGLSTVVNKSSCPVLIISDLFAL
jgi:hypothetical protein